MSQQLFLIVGISFSLLLGLVMLTKKHFFYLGLVFVCCCLILVEDYFWFLQSRELLLFFAELLTPLSFVIPSLLYFQSKAFNEQSIKFRWLYFMIPLLAYLNFTPLYFGSIDFKNCYIEHELSDLHSSSCMSYINNSPVLISEELLDVVLIIQFALLFIALLKDGNTKDLKRRSKKMRTVFGSWRVQYLWLVAFVCISIVVTMWLATEHYSAKSIFISAVGMVVCFLLLKQSALIDGWRKSNSYATVSTDDMSTTLQRLRDTLLRDSLYASSSLTLDLVAEQLGTSSNKLSFVINAQETTFREIVNAIRIQKAIELLHSDEGKNYSMDGIAQKVGYKSKSTFYKNFKAVMSVTPKQYLTNRTK